MVHLLKIGLLIRIVKGTIMLFVAEIMAVFFLRTKVLWEKICRVEVT